jgi:hypothetical protein
MLKATNKKCYYLEDNKVPQKVQTGIKETTTSTGYFPFLLDLIVISHKKCRTKHKFAWKKRFNKLTKFLTRKTIDGDQLVNQSDLNVAPPNFSSDFITPISSSIKEVSNDDFTDKATPKVKKIKVKKNKKQKSE